MPIGSAGGAKCSRRTLKPPAEQERLASALPTNCTLLLQKDIKAYYLLRRVKYRGYGAMDTCNKLRQKLNKHILTPLTIFITKSEQACEDLGQWGTVDVPAKVWQVSSTVRKVCRKLPWPLDWFCKAVTDVVRTLIDGFVSIIAWIANIVCHLVVRLLGTIVTLVMRVITWTIEFVVCLVTNPLEALKSLYDLWVVLLDGVDGLVDAFAGLLHDVQGLLGDLERVVDAAAGDLGWAGLILAPFKAALSLGKRVFGIAADAVDGANDAVLGTLSGNPCRLSRGLANVAAAGGRALVEGALVIGGYAVGGAGGALIGAGVRGAGLTVGSGRDLVRLKVACDVMEIKLNAAFGDDPARLERARDAVMLGSSNGGVAIKSDARRIFLSSRSEMIDLRALHQRGVLNLYAYAGYAGNCHRLINEPETEVVYAGTRLRVSFTDIQTYLAAGPDAVPEFQVFPISRTRFRAVLDIARDKFRYLGIRFSAPTIVDQPTASPNWVPLELGPNTDQQIDIPQREIWSEIFDRDGLASDPLGTIPALAHFHYELQDNGKELHGLTSWFRVGDERPSGVSFRIEAPFAIFSYVLVHEMGHYVGLDHKDGTRGVDEIMFSPSSGTVTVQMFYEFLLLGGEPRFTFGDIDDAWEWFTTAAKDALFP